MAHLTYKDAGVDIDAGDELVERIKPAVKKTNRKEVIGGLGGYGALTRIPAGYKEPVLVSGTDGVGTKLRLAIDLKRHSTVGIDLVAMCVNDLVVQGAEALFFLDYYATGKLDVDTATTVVNGIAKGCEIAGCALVGGETAEMPGMYSVGDYDLAGFAVGVVEASKIIDGTAVKEGDAIIGLPSSGPHSNGYSLIRRIIKDSGADMATETLPCGKLVADALMEPTRIYVKPLLKLLEKCEVHAMAHITGGGFWDNIPRVLPKDCCAAIDATTWKRPEVFDWLEEKGGVDKHEMYRTFNCGMGMIVILPQDQVEAAVASLTESGEQPVLIGKVTRTGADGHQVTIAGI